VLIPFTEKSQVTVEWTDLDATLSVPSYPMHHTVLSDTRSVGTLEVAQPMWLALPLLMSAAEHVVTVRGREIRRFVKDLASALRLMWTHGSELSTWIERWLTVVDRERLRQSRERLLSHFEDVLHCANLVLFNDDDVQKVVQLLL